MHMLSCVPWLLWKCIDLHNQRFLSLAINRLPGTFDANIGKLYIK